ncbi:MAG TPA: HTH domain-containing protein [Streptosporangiaceae bacterium]|nr:HTH domain-containing protein [Streptosporangiaceae bacterium]
MTWATGDREAGAEALAARREERIQAYLAINGPHMPAARAALRLGVTRRTIIRYRQDLKTRGQLKP